MHTHTEPVMIYGTHAVEEALSYRPDIVRVLYCTGEIDTKIAAILQKYTIPRKEFHAHKLPVGVPKDAVHQGIAATIDTTKLLIPFDTFIQECEVTNSTGLVLMGEIQDPQNVGAIIRSSAAFGISAVLLPEHRQTQITGSVVKVSVGAAFRIPLVSVTNVNRAIETLKSRNFWIYGLDHEAKQSVTDEGFEKPSVFVIGNEAKGIREKTLEHCDIPLRIPITGNTESLNASVAAGVVLYAWRSKKVL